MPKSQAFTVAIGALQSFPSIVETETGVTMEYGKGKPLSFPISLTERVEFDPALLRGKGTIRLVNIKTAKKLAGKDDKAGTVWFNREVRDPWHKVLKFAARQSLAHGTPVSLGLSRRKNRKTGEQVLTTKHGFEFIEIPALDKSIADKARKQSKNRAKRQNRKNKPLVSVGDAMKRIVTVNVETPVVPTA